MSKNTSASTDRDIVCVLVRAESTGDFPGLTSAKRELHDLQIQYLNEATDAAAMRQCDERVRRFLQSRPELHDDIVTAVTRDALDFIKSEINRAARIKQVRPLTEDEKEIGTKRLTEILDSLQNLLRNRSENEKDL